ARSTVRSSTRRAERRADPAPLTSTGPSSSAASARRVAERSRRSTEPDTSSASVGRAARRSPTSSNAPSHSSQPRKRNRQQKRRPPNSSGAASTAYLGPLMDRRELGAGTRVVRAARSLPPGQGEPVVPPLVQSVAFDYGSAAEQDAVFGGDRPGYVYGRYGTPTTAALESAMAELDRLARENGASLAVDATFATPVLFRPAALGATMVIHSLTKYVNGHGDVMGGSVGGSTELCRAMRDRTILDGAYLPPHEAWLA